MSRWARRARYSRGRGSGAWRELEGEAEDERREGSTVKRVRGEAEDV